MSPTDAPVLGDSRSLASSLEPVLSQACAGRLSPVTWFRADWQRGGAATGTATIETGGAAAEVVVKLPVVPRELAWVERLQDPADPDPVVPRLYASGRELGGYDLAWMVIERFPFGPLGGHWHDGHVARVAEAAARFHAAAARFDCDQPARREDWEAQLRAASQNLRLNAVPRRQEWQTALKALHGKLDRLLEHWEARDARQWLHGDLHLANAMSRVSLESGPVCLIDFGEVRAGHWVEDAVYLERQLWPRPERLRPLSPVKAIAAARKRLGLPADPDYPRLAAIRRALLAATAPAYMRSEGDPRHLDSCLDWLQRALADLRPAA
jgi:hypothetical protein